MARCLRDLSAFLQWINYLLVHCKGGENAMDTLNACAEG
jgi:hypothetical protein